MIVDTPQITHVYLVYLDVYSLGYNERVELLGVFSSKKLAEQYIKEDTQSYNKELYYIEEININTKISLVY